MSPVRSARSWPPAHGATWRPAKVFAEEKDHW